MNNPKCPYCGETMALHLRHGYFSYFCPSCYSEAPIRTTTEEAYAAAMKREKKRKTYAEDFKERCPNHLHNCGMPIVCRNEVYGFGGRCTVEEAVERGGCSSCWNAEMEDKG